MIDELKSLTNKLLVAVLIVLLLVFLRTCSLNDTKDLQQIKAKQDSTLALINNEIKDIDKALLELKNSQTDLMQFSLYKDDLSTKQDAIKKLKQRVNYLQSNGSK